MLLLNQAFTKQWRFD